MEYHLRLRRKNLSISLFNGRLRFEGDGPSYSGFAYSIEPDDGYVPFSLETPNPLETCVEYGCIFPLSFPLLAPGSTAYTETRVEIKVDHCVQGRSNELLLRETANSTHSRTGRKP